MRAAERVARIVGWLAGSAVLVVAGYRLGATGATATAVPTPEQAAWAVSVLVGAVLLVSVTARMRGRPRRKR